MLKVNKKGMKKIVYYLFLFIVYCFTFLYIRFLKHLKTQTQKQVLFTLKRMTDDDVFSRFAHYILRSFFAAGFTISFNHIYRERER